MSRSHGVRTMIIARLVILVVVTGVVYVPSIARAQACHPTEEPEVSAVVTELIYE
jgi:hypothetical protein